MKCIRCNHDSKHKDRKNQTCPKCKGAFAFEPQEKDPVTDVAFQNAINRVSGNGKVRFGNEHLYYEVNRRLRPRFPRGRGMLAPLATASVVGGMFVGVPWLFGAGWISAIAAVVLGATGTVQGVRWFNRNRQRTVLLDRARFSGMTIAWERAHGRPVGLIVRAPEAAARAPSRALQYEMVDYSFDRAVICDRASTVDLLLANNFHFENNCAVLTYDGYPSGPFETIRTMLKRNPKLRAFALHDATVDGCTLAHRLATDPAWFAGQVPVTDVGLRPGQAEPVKGLGLRAPAGAAVAGHGITASEAAWLTQYSLELAAIRPDQILKRLFRAMNRQDDDADDGGGVFFIGDGDDGRVIEDAESFSSDANADDGGADSFG